MMGLEEIRKDIEDRAIREKGEIEQATATVEKAIADESRKETEQIKQRNTDEIAEIRKRQKLVKEAEAKSAASQILLEQKQLIIDEVFKAAEAALKKKSAEYMPNLVRKAEGLMEVDKVRCNPQDKKFAGKKSAPDDSIAGGIIAENKDGSVSLDLTYASLLKTIRQKNILEISQALFP